ncbi:TetR/AcrR family transcriptional regulator [Streptomyces sp. NBC_00562]|uniref:TetR/AcrR family transcriptional regulator n=1 Tax=Streptomyces sp. NBC_00562 TaxID=2975777 RepID=UPI002E80E585|nr:helix-turn-helix domain-containing protein [Streptomyces sp. NBC_00562]WUC17564.1 TetR/AcrR family transcriptional regulator [Streptomyces sp. NBC_00562]WUC25103.1 TetR/AcrR family transcriptional regulator [Streptomyces sp. NBC_00562]
MTAATTTPGQRADMVRNRRLLLDAAAAAFAEHGLEASMGEIAQRAGLAKGTVFRHFPTKEDLLAAIMLRLLDRLAGSAGRALEADDAAAALREFMTNGVEALAADRAFCEVIGRPSLQHAEVRDAIAELCVAVEALTARAREQGAIRSDITGTDIVLLLGGIHQTAAPLLATQPQAWRRYLELALDGLRTLTPSALPHRPPLRPELTDSAPT